ncbi:MAG: hypothetical protein P5684_26540, partial [Limnospira sp. PMC 1238.20]
MVKKPGFFEKPGFSGETVGRVYHNLGGELRIDGRGAPLQLIINNYHPRRVRQRDNLSGQRPIWFIS